GVFMDKCVLFKDCCIFVFDTVPSEVYTLSLHDALPISSCASSTSRSATSCRSSLGPPSSRRTTTCSSTWPGREPGSATATPHRRDRKSTRLNSSHDQISYAVFCLKKKSRLTSLHLQSSY